MLDFTSALYLGMAHPSAALRPWAKLSTGAPAALREPPGSAQAASALAALTGCERAVLSPSTLHLCWDLFGILASAPLVVHVDAGTYPVGWCGVERAAARGAEVKVFRHHDADGLAISLAEGACTGAPQVVLTDGFCPSCGSFAPLADYLDLARSHGGLLVVDDTQSLGIHGSVAPGAPYGRGGGGSPRRLGIEGPELVLVASLAKGFGVPVAVLSGSDALITAFTRESSTRVHSSPPSAAVLRAAEHAIEENRARGDRSRLALANNVRRFREGLQAAGLASVGGLFPVQTPASWATPAPTLHARLSRRGVRTVLYRPSCGAPRDRGPRVGFVVRSDHAPAELDAAVDALLSASGAPDRRGGLRPEVTGSPRAAWLSDHEGA